MLVNIVEDLEAQESDTPSGRDKNRTKGGVNGGLKSMSWAPLLNVTHYKVMHYCNHITFVSSVMHHCSKFSNQITATNQTIMLQLALQKFFNYLHGWRIEKSSNILTIAMLCSAPVERLLSLGSLC